MGNKWLNRRFPPSDKIQPDAWGFPQDDEHSIYCNDGGTADLSYYYDWQFVQNEKAELKERWDFPGWVFCEYGLSRKTIMAESISANLWAREGDIIKRYGFSVDCHENFKFEDPEAPVVPWLCSLKDGKIFVYWKKDPGMDHFMLVSYEYNMEDNK